MRLDTCLPLAVLLVTLASAPALGQDDVRTYHGPGGRDAGFGNIVAAAPDLNADGTPDLLIDEIGARNVYVISGATDEVLRTLGPPSGAVRLFGLDVAAVPDTDGDDVADIAVGASHEDRTGRVYVFSGASGALLRTFKNPTAMSSDHFGRRVAGSSDLDGDGRGDLIVSGSDIVGGDRTDRAFVFSGATGALLSTLGTGVEAVASVRDADGDDVDDILVGARSQGGTPFSSPGQISLFSGASGALLYTLDNPSGQNSNFGWAVTGVGDLDGDGRGDFVVSDNAYNSATAYSAGRAYVFSGASGALRAILESPAEERYGRFGTSVAELPDANNDDVNDILVGAAGEGVSGGAHAFSGASGALLRSFASPSPEPNGGFGLSVAGVPDLDGDGAGEALIGARGENGRAGRAYLFTGPPTNRPLIINSTTDRADADGDGAACDTGETIVRGADTEPECTLRAAIQTANARAGRDSISVDIEGDGPHTIALMTSLPALTEALVLDATTQPGYDGSPRLTITGSGIARGFVTDQGETTLRGLALGGFEGAAVYLTGRGGNVIESSYIGLDASGALRANGLGIVIDGSPDNVVGGERPDGGSDRGNVISGSVARAGDEDSGTGLLLRGEGATGNRVEGNRIGTDPTGTSAVPNLIGVLIDQAPDNVIGGERTADGLGRGNVISGAARRDGADDQDPTGTGVLIRGAAASGNTVMGNYIGTDATGTVALGNKLNGVFLWGAPRNEIGGDTALQGNLISGSARANVVIYGKGADRNRVAGNTIGPDVTGTTALSAGSGGIEVLFGSENTIGGMTGAAGQAPGNLISGHTGTGVVVLGVSESAEDPDYAIARGNRVLGNLIGTDRGGTSALPNEGGGVLVFAQAFETVIGAAGGGNVVSGNGNDGITLGSPRAEGVGSGDGPFGSTVAANYVGTDLSGTSVIPNNGPGIELGSYFVGDDGDGSDGGAGRRGRADRSETVPLSPAVRRIAARSLEGGDRLQARHVLRGDDFGPVVIGGPTAADGNLVAGNDFAEVLLPYGQIAVVANDPFTSALAIVGNQVGVLSGGTLAPSPELPEAGSAGILTVADDTAIGLGLGESGEVYVSGNEVGGFRYGIALLGNGAIVGGNEIGVRRTTASPIPNEVGVWVVGDGARIGAGERSRANVISSNARYGVLVGETAGFDLEFEDRTPHGAWVVGNAIGTSRGRGVPRGNGRAETSEAAGAGVAIVRGHSHLLVANTISSNGNGVLLANGSGGPADSSTLLTTNIIGLAGSVGDVDEDGQLTPTLLPNQYDGIRSEDSSARIVVDLPEDVDGVEDLWGNWIWGNGGSGVRVEGSAEVLLLGNLISDNGGLGVDFSAPGVGGGLAPPRLFLPTRPTGDEVGTVYLRPGQSGLAQVFFSRSCDPSGSGEGQWLGALKSVSAGELVEIETPVGRGTSPSGELTTYVPSDLEALYVTALLTVGDRTSEFSECVRVADEGDTVEEEIGPGDAGPVLAGVGIEVSLPAARRGGGAADTGTLYAARYHVAPQRGPVEGSATAPDGSTLTPNIVATGRYWTLTTDSLEVPSYSICLDIDGVRGVQAPQQLVVVHRPTLAHPWTPIASTLDGSRLCANGLTAWGDLGLGADSSANPVPNEPAPTESPEAVPEVLGVSIHPNPAHKTASVAVSLPASGWVRATVHDALGRRVAVLHEGDLAAGTHPLLLGADGLPAGMYVVRAEAGGRAVTRTLTVVR